MRQHWQSQSTGFANERHVETQKMIHHIVNKNISRECVNDSQFIIRITKIFCQDGKL